ncbi:hypothetical protein M426DRAFT_10604 [Hypoxylon sp. CI-4A]|nr:hypothetical protein M426DRAFT_10604 [Hypoxylon sp. CI-4A]
MDTTTSSNSGRSSHAAIAYSHLFKPRPSARKIQKRNSAPIKTSDQKAVPVALPSSTVRLVAAATETETSHRKTETRSSPVENANSNFRSALVAAHHSRIGLDQQSKLNTKWLCGTVVVDKSETCAQGAWKWSGKWPVKSRAATLLKAIYQKQLVNLKLMQGTPGL